MTKTLIIIASFGLIGVSFVIGWWARRRAASAQAFFGGTALFGPLTISLSSLASVASAFAVVGVPGLMYKTGNTIALWMLASPAFAIAYLTLGKKVRAMAEVAPIASLGDISDLRFNGHRGIKALLSFVLFLGCISYLASQIKACSVLFSHLLGWSEILAGAVIFGVLILYTLISGEVGGILTQAFQGFVMVLAGLVLIIAFFAITGGFAEVVQAVSTAGAVGSGDIAKTFGPELLDAWGTLPGSYALAWVLIPVMGLVCQPQVLTRIYALRDPLDLPRLTLYVTVAHMIVGLMVVAVAHAALYLVATGAIPPLTDADQAVYSYAAHIGVYAQVLVYAAVLAAAMSTSSLFLSLSGNIVARDMPAALGLKVRPDRQVALARATMVVLGVGAIVFAIFSGEMVATLGAFGYGTLMSATIPVFLIGLLWKRTSSQGVFAGLIVSAVGNVVAPVLSRVGIAWPGGLPSYVGIVAATVTVTVAVSLVTRGATGDDLDERVELVIEL